MKQILSDFIRRRTGMLIKCALIAVGFAAAAWIPLMFSGGWADWFRLVWTIGAVVVSAAVASLLVKAFVDIFGVVPSGGAAQQYAGGRTRRRYIRLPVGKGPR